MGCDHTGPADVIEKTESFLHDSDRAPVRGMRFGWGENVDTMWKSIYIEIERREEGWIVTRLDRNENRLEDDQIGLREIS